MIIVSSNKFNLESDTMTYDEFISKAYSDEGLDEDPEGIFLDVNEISESVYNDVKDLDIIGFFTTNGSSPSFIKSEVNDLSSYVVEKTIEDTIGDDMSPSVKDSIISLINSDTKEDLVSPVQKPMSEKKDARVIAFGSSKGGTGKTFTSLISTYRYAKQNPTERIALIDFDIIDGQVGISIHKVRPTMRDYLVEYQKGFNDFETMKNFSVKSDSKPYPKNVDFYLAPNTGTVIKNDDFWLNILQNVIENYDLVVFDTGIDYLNINPISYVYKIADKINIVTTTSIKSVNSVLKQIAKLKGKSENATFSKEDEIGARLNIIITQMVESNNLNETIYESLSNEANVIATFGVITDSVSRAEYYGDWDVFDKSANINKSLDIIMS